ncbi:integrase, catalytic region, zinc finger, CCHC-type containing protein [Tanacetum coccineum]
MRRTMQNKVDRETRFNNEFDQFIVEPGEALVSDYNRFAQLMNDLERNGIIFPKFTVNTKFLNCLQPEWLKNTRRSYVQEEFIEGTNVQNDAGNIQRTLRTTSSGTATNVQCYNCSEKGHYARNCLKPRFQDSKYFMEQMLLAKQDEAGVILTDKQNDFLFADASRMEEIKELSANICLMARIQPVNFDSDAEPSYDYAFLSGVQTPSTNYVNPLFVKDKQEQKYPKQPKIINNTIGDDQTDSNHIFDEPNEDVNNGSVEYDNNVQESYELEQLARNAFKEGKKQQIIAKKVQQQNTVLTKQLESYKKKVWVFEMTKGNNTTYFNEYIEADRKARRFEKESQSQFIHDRDIIRDLEQQRDKLELSVVELKRQTVELQKT